jgi:hypothetical protein
MNNSHQKEWGTLLEAVAVITEMTGATSEEAGLILCNLWNTGKIRYRSDQRSASVLAF